MVFFVVPKQLKNSVQLIVLSLWMAAFFNEVAAGTTHSDAKKLENYIIGVNADLSLAAASAGQAIRSGVEIAVQEFNATRPKGVRQAEVIALDHFGVSLRGVENLKKLAKLPNLIGVIGGIHSNVILTELESIHRFKIPYLIPWAAAVEIVDNGYRPNYVFRVGARDQHVGRFISNKALKTGKRIALILEQTVWGRSNYRAISTTLQEGSVLPVRTEWFARGANEFKVQIAEIVRARPDVVIMVLNGPESEMALRELALLNFKGSVLSHWGVTSGGFNPHVLNNSPFSFQFIQLFSFIRNKKELTRRMLKSYLKKHPESAAERIEASGGLAFSYDLTRILLWAAKDEWPVRRERIREKIETYPGGHSIAELLEPPFTATRHDGLDPNSYFWARFTSQGAIVPQ